MWKSFRQQSLSSNPVLPSLNVCLTTLISLGLLEFVMTVGRSEPTEENPIRPAERILALSDDDFAKWLDRVIAGLKGSL